MSPAAVSSTLSASPKSLKLTRPSSLRLESFSPEPSIRDVDYSSDIDAPDSGSASDSTVEDLEAVMNHYDFGYPLQRMPVIPRRSSLGFMDHTAIGQDPGDEETDDAYFSEYSESECSTSSSAIYDNIDFEAVVDDLVAEQSIPKSRNFIMVEPSSPSAHDAFMIRPLLKQSTSQSRELDILITLNEYEARQDPWNPVPHLLSVVDRLLPNNPEEGYTFVCVERLNKFDDPPLRTVANYIDFIRQTLEGLTFLHEHHVTGLNYETTDSFMVDIGLRSGWSSSNVLPSPSHYSHSSASSSAPSPPTPTQTQRAHQMSTAPSSTVTPSPNSFDRTKYPVRYYYTDFSGAKLFDGPSPTQQEMYKNDVRQCGRVIEGLVGQIPRVAPKMKALVNAMTSGTFGADDARKLFEALCQSLEASVFDSPVVPAGSSASSPNGNSQLSLAVLTAFLASL
ncbi:hypothetical protein ONZ45_g261 [Pleurotus djamor]|nr:hypothetical protein ONZ45_g261 [Pleurotus djamor]